METPTPDSYIEGIVTAEGRGEIEYYDKSGRVEFSIADVPRLVKPNKQHPMRFVYDDGYSSLRPPYSLAGGMKPVNSRPMIEEAGTITDFLEESEERFKVLVLGPGTGKECNDMRGPSVGIHTISRSPFNPRVIMNDTFGEVHRKTCRFITDITVRKEIKKRIIDALSSASISPEMLCELGLLEVKESPVVQKQIIADLPNQGLVLPDGEYKFIYDNYGPVDHNIGTRRVKILEILLSALHEEGAMLLAGRIRAGDLLDAMKRARNGQGFQLTKLPWSLLITRPSSPVLMECNYSDPDQDLRFGEYENTRI